MRAGSPGWVSALLALLLAVGGCATVPISGPVERHTPAAPGLDPGVRVDPLPPASGASQLLVVEGFLHAMGTYQPDYSVARQYLTEEASRDWHPTSGVQIYHSSSLPTATEQSVVLSARVTGRLDAAGTYTAVGADAPPLRQDFGLVEDSAGQWRISRPPDGLLVSEYVFTTGFVSTNLYFPDRDGTVLVPEPRLFAAGDQSLTAAVQALLAGASDWLSPVVVGRLDPAPTLLSLSVVGGTAAVDLGGATSEVTAAQRRLLLAQLAYTLTGFSQIRGIEVTANGVPWRDDSGSTFVTPSSFSELSPTNPSRQRGLYLVQDGAVQQLQDPTNWDQRSDVEVGFVRPESLAIRGDEVELAAVSHAGTRLSVGRVGVTKASILRTGAGLLRPAYTRFGELWSPASARLKALQVFRDGERLSVRVDQTSSAAIPQLRVISLAIAPDGVRAALVLGTANKTEVGLVRVERTEGRITLTGWRPIGLPAITGEPGPARELGWVASTELVLLQAGDEGTAVLRMAQDGSANTDIGPSETTELTRLAVSPGRTIVALAPAGSLYRRDGDFNWSLAAMGITEAAYPG